MLPALSHSQPSSSASSLVDVPIHDRPNQHLAVLLPKQLWKPDSATSTCDNFYCRIPFSLWDRKHHCRKCGGIFCGACTSRTTPLLDTSNLSFLQPPRNTPLANFESPLSPIIDSRVCDDCWDQIHGCPATPHTPDVERPSFKRVLSHPITLIFPSSSTSSIPSSPVSATGIPINLPRKQRSQSLRNTSSASSLDTQSSSNSNPTSKRLSVRPSLKPLPQDLERSYGELDAYPLRRSSTLCKASGGGRWEPKQSPVMPGYRIPIPGGKAPYEIQMEQDELHERQRRLNPVVKDGDFQYRFPREPEPIVLSRSPFNLSTF